MRLPIILIGLSIFILKGCILTEIDPPPKKYFDIYRNKSDSNITVYIKNISNEEITSVTLGVDEEGGLKNQDVAFSGGDEPVEEYISDLLRAEFKIIELFVHNELVKRWSPDDATGNNPFNNSSWEVVFPIIQEDGLERGKIIFTITNADIE